MTKLLLILITGLILNLPACFAQDSITHRDMKAVSVARW